MLISMVCKSSLHLLGNNAPSGFETCLVLILVRDAWMDSDYQEHYAKC